MNSSIAPTDPDSYTRPSDCVDVDSDTLRAAYANARETYYSCGGHWRAARAEQAMNSTAAELAKRGITPQHDEPGKPSILTGWAGVE